MADDLKIDPVGQASINRAFRYTPKDDTEAMARRKKEMEPKPEEDKGYVLKRGEILDVSKLK